MQPWLTSVAELPRLVRPVQPDRNPVYEPHKGRT
jgi:hypothetical protein